MKKADVTLGKTYTAKVTDRIVPVRIDRENPQGGWDGTNLKTKKKIRIKSARRLRGVYCSDADVQPAQSDNRRLANERTTAPSPPVATRAKKAEKASKATNASRKTNTAQRGAKQKRPSALDGAAQLLAEASEPLSCKTMVHLMLERKLWKTGGKTPANTLYAAILREIKIKGTASRFRKVERGKFTRA